MIHRNIRAYLTAAFLLVACERSSETNVDSGSSGGRLDTGDSVDADVASPSALPALQFCTVSDARDLPGAYVSQGSEGFASYSCAVPCNNGTACAVDAFDTQGNPLLSSRGNLRIKLLAFVVDEMAGHIAFTPDGDDVVITHAGVGGTTVFNGFDRALQSRSMIKTVSLGWESGVQGVFGSGTGWFTRKSAQPSSIRKLAVRPAAVIRWVKDNFAVGKKLGTVGQSMGTVATLAPHVWYGLEPILDYQLLMGGPPLWDINIGCGRVHTSEGYCDVDLAPCTGNPNSSFGDDDPTCGSATNHCRVPTVMAPKDGGSLFRDLINYLGATTACTPTTTDNRDTALDESSMMTVTDWAFHGKVDIVMDEGGMQPPNADQGMGEGHAMRIYLALTGPKSWTDNEGHHHGDSFSKEPSLVMNAAMKVITAITN